jgi:cyclase
MRTSKPRPVRLVFILAAVLPILAVFLAAGQAPPAVQQISPSLYLVKGGSGANAAFYVTPEGVFVIDAKMRAESAAGMLAEIKKVTNVPVTTLIITHSDGDHINGLPGFPKGLQILAHEKCRADIAGAAETRPELRDYIPNRAYDQPRLEIYAGGTTVVLAYFGPAPPSGRYIGRAVEVIYLEFTEK